MFSIRNILVLTATVSLLSACGSNKDDATEDKLLAETGNYKLYNSQLMAEMPSGLSSQDSTKFARAYIRQWIESKLVSDIASEEIDLEQINRMVEEYRNELIMWEYRRRMFDKSNKQIPDDSIRAYYEAHKQEYKLDRPMVKGVYIKVADDSPSLNQLRKYYTSTDVEDIENLEKATLTGAVNYDYFQDKWIDWEQIESRIPYEFGNSSDHFLATHKTIDTSVGGFTYLLSITDYLPSGSQMPFENARERIIDRLITDVRKQFDTSLVHNLYENSLKNGKAKIYCDM